MLNAMSDMKRLVRVDPEDLDLSDTGALESGNTPWEEYLEGASMVALSHLIQWTTVPEAGPYDSSLRRAEVILVQAEIALDFGFTESMDPSEIQTGGSSGQKIKRTIESPEQRAERAWMLRERARRLVGGEEHTGFAGVAG